LEVEHRSVHLEIDAVKVESEASKSDVEAEE